MNRHRHAKRLVALTPLFLLATPALGVGVPLFRLAFPPDDAFQEKGASPTTLVVISVQDGAPAERASSRSVTCVCPSAPGVSNQCPKPGASKQIAARRTNVVADGGQPDAEAGRLPAKATVADARQATRLVIVASGRDAGCAARERPETEVLVLAAPGTRNDDAFTGSQLRIVATGVRDEDPADPPAREVAALPTMTPGGSQRLPFHIPLRLPQSVLTEADVPLRPVAVSDQATQRHAASGPPEIPELFAQDESALAPNEDPADAGTSDLSPSPANAPVATTLVVTDVHENGSDLSDELPASAGKAETVPIDNPTETATIAAELPPFDDSLQNQAESRRPVATESVHVTARPAPVAEHSAASVAKQEEVDMYAREAARPSVDETPLSLPPVAEPEYVSEAEFVAATTPSEDAPSGLPETVPPPAPEEVEQWRISPVEAVLVGMSNNKDVRVLGYQPQIAATEIAQECSYFDPIFGASGYGGQDDRQVRSLIESQGALVASQRTDFFQPLYQPNQVFVLQPLYTGGVFTYGFGTEYLNYDPPGDFLFVNPGWDSNVNARLTQPLGRGRGYDVAVAPLRIAQASAAQSRFEFVSQVRQIVLDIEIAYWNLAGARREVQLLRQSHALAKQLAGDEAERERLGRSSLPDVLIARGLETTIGVQAAEAERNAVIASDQLRQVMGLTVFGDADQGGYEGVAAGAADQVLMPLVRPEDVEVDLHWGLAVQTAMARPDIASQRAAIRAMGLALAQARNGMLPNVSLQADYAVTGLEEAFGDSLATIGRHEFNRWGVGLYYERPIGMRSAKATVRQAQLQLARENARLRKLEHDIVHQLRQAYDSVRTANAIWLQQQQHVRLLEEQIQVYTELHREGEVELFRLLDVQTDLVDAQIQANAAWTTARLAEARWRYEKSEDLAFYNLHLAP